MVLKNSNFRNEENKTQWRKVLPRKHSATWKVGIATLLTSSPTPQDCCVQRWG